MKQRRHLNPTPIFRGCEIDINPDALASPFNENPSIIFELAEEPQLASPDELERQLETMEQQAQRRIAD